MHRGGAGNCRGRGTSPRCKRIGVPRSNDSHDLRVICQSGLGSWFLGAADSRKRYRNIAARANFPGNRRGRKSWVNSHAHTSAVRPHPRFNLTRGKITRKRNLKSNPRISIDLVPYFQPEYRIILSDGLVCENLSYSFDGCSDRVPSG